MLRAVLAISVFGLIGGCASKGDIDELNTKIDKLSEQVAALGSGSQARAGGGDDQAALALYKEAAGLRQSGKDADARSKFLELVKKYPKNRYAQRAQQRDLAELMLVGSDAKPIAIDHVYQGEQPNLSEGVSVLIFWEKWCGYCKKEVPKLEATFQKYGDKMAFVGLTKQTKNTTKEDVEKFIADSKISYPIMKETGQASKDYAISGIPAAAVVKDGKVVFRGHPGGLTDAKLESFLN